MSGKYKKYAINEDGSRCCIHCQNCLPSENFKYGYKTVCFNCVLKRGREKHKEKLFKQGKDLRETLSHLKTGTKKCTKCKIEKGISEFRNENKTSKRIRSNCKSCEHNDNKLYELNNRDSINKKRRERRKDPINGIVFSIRDRYKSIFRSNGIKKTSESTYKLRLKLGISIEDCKKHIESLFSDGMNWNNRGVGINKWQIDHKIPISLLEINNGEVLDNEWNDSILHYTNLQPLWHLDNAIKSNKYERVITTKVSMA